MLLSLSIQLNIQSKLKPELKFLLVLQLIFFKLKSGQRKWNQVQDLKHYSNLIFEYECDIEQINKPYPYYELPWKN